MYEGFDAQKTRIFYAYDQAHAQLLKNKQAHG